MKKYCHLKLFWLQTGAELIHGHSFLILWFVKLLKLDLNPMAVWESVRFFKSFNFCVTFNSFLASLSIWTISFLGVLNFRWKDEAVLSFFFGVLEFLLKPFLTLFSNSSIRSSFSTSSKISLNSASEIPGSLSGDTVLSSPPPPRLIILFFRFWTQQRPWRPEGREQTSWSMLSWSTPTQDDGDWHCPEIPLLVTQIELATKLSDNWICLPESYSQ